MAENNRKGKTCFVIMPFTDPIGYEEGHFQRVYNGIIEPACKKAGFVPHKVNDDNRTNLIIAEIIRQIIESDIVLCDLSSKNPNVLYELGIRQAFNKKVVLIKDDKTDRIFDIQGLNTIDYSHNLRYDEVASNIDTVSNSLKSTYESQNGINSLIQLLSIKPPEVTAPIEITNDTKLILDILRDLSKRIANIEINRDCISSTDKVIHDLLIDVDSIQLTSGEKAFIGDILYLGNVKIGKLLEIQNNDILLYNDDTEKYTIVQKENINQLSLKLITN